MTPATGGANRLWVRDSRQLVRLAEEIIRQQRFFQSRPDVYGERNRTHWFVETHARRMLAIMQRAERRDRRQPEEYKAEKDVVRL